MIYISNALLSTCIPYGHPLSFPYVIPRKPTQLHLVNPENTGAPLLLRLLLLLATVKRRSSHVVTAHVVKVLDLVDADDPVLAGEGLLHRVEDGALVRQPDTTHAISNLASGEQVGIVVVRHLVPRIAVNTSLPPKQEQYSHQAVLHCLGGIGIHLVLATGREEVALLDLIRPDTLGNTDHPEELVDIISRVSKETTKHNEYVVDLVLAHDGVADLLTGAHGLAHRRDVRVVPRVVVNQSRAVRHATNLVAVVPPRHDLGVLLGVLAKPLVRLSVIINDVLATIRHSAGQNDRRRRVGVGGDPGAVSHKHQQVDGHGSSHNNLGESRVNANLGLLRRSQTTLGSLRGVTGLGNILGAGGLDLKIGVENLRDRNGSSNTDDGSQRQHETDHDTGKVAGEERVDDNKDMLIPEVLEAHVNTRGEEPNEEVEIKEERWPGGRLVLRDGGNDGNVNLGVAGIPQRVESTVPGGNVSKRGQADNAGDANAEYREQDSVNESLELLARNGRSNVLDEADQLNKTKDA